MRIRIIESRINALLMRPKSHIGVFFVKFFSARSGLAIGHFFIVITGFKFVFVSPPDNEAALIIPVVQSIFHRRHYRSSLIITREVA